MGTKKKKNSFLTLLMQLPFKILFSRFTLAFLALIIQVLIIYFCAVFFQRYLLLLFGGSAVFGFILTIYIINQPGSPSFHISWIILILLFPALGVFVYLFVKLQVGVHALSNRYQKIRNDMILYLRQDEKILHKLQEEDESVLRYVTYMNRISGYPIYQHTKTKYYPLGDDMFPDLIEDLRHAKDYIFLEYFIVAKGYMWNTILDILKEKVKEGVRVYFMYDGTCSFMLLPRNYPEELKAFGIHCKVFNPVVPVISTQYNNRDHRKIVVVDGKVGYTGGVNLADEYINQLERFGHWKDNAIRIEGEAVKNFILMFLENWFVDEKGPQDYDTFLNGVVSKRSSSYVLPFGDNPFDQYPVGQVSYLHLIQTANHFIHIMMPYFIVDHEMLHSLCNAAMSGVEVKLLMPHIPDKTWIYYVARTFYKELISSGVEIYEYTPGFVHAKMVIADGREAIIGSINMDYRSLYLHFEDAVYLYQDSSILDMEKDYQNTLEMCEFITLDHLKKYPLWKRIIGRVLRVIAPLL